MSVHRNWLAIGCSAALLFACAEERTAPAPRRQSAARALGIFGPELAVDPTEQALVALASDARRREARFFDATNPGFLFASTRVPQEEIDHGLWSPRELFQLGAQLFHQRFRREDGFGGADLPRFGRFQTGLRGGPDAYQCADCHRRGGLAGAGDAADNAYLDGDGDTQATALERNPIALTGVGVIELLAKELTAELSTQRALLIAQAQANGAPVRGALSAKGISYGFLTAYPDGTVYTRDVDGIDADLVVKPFGWKGHTATIRAMVEHELASHHGMQSDFFVATASEALAGPFGQPDPDGDGVVGEISEGQVTALSLFLAMQEIPTDEPPTVLHPELTSAVDLLPMWTDGVARFREIGCASCHVPSMTLDSATYVLAARSAGPSVQIDLAEQGAEPRLKRQADGSFRVWLFSDLKRHDMGTQLADAKLDHGLAPSLFLTPPLWGVARSRPYLHDGRAPTLEAAILAHGGEAQAARDAYAELDDHGRGTIRVYLTALTRARRFVAP